MKLKSSSEPEVRCFFRFRIGIIIDEVDAAYKPREVKPFQCQRCRFGFLQIIIKRKNFGFCNAFQKVITLQKW